MITSLSDFLLPNPFKIQCAINKQWEKAWKMDPKNITALSEDISTFVGTEEIAAIELFYKTKDNTDFYLGIQYHKELKNAPTVYDFFYIYFSIIKSETDLSLQNIVKQLGMRLEDNEKLIQLGDPTSIAIGVVDYWMTYGPCTIWNSGEEKVLNKNILKTRLKTHENLIRNKDNNIGLEFIYLCKPKYWFSFQVSSKQKDSYVLKLSEIQRLLRSYLSF